jgi:hypothetical protein
MFNGPLKLDTKRSSHAIAPDGLELAVLAPQLMGERAASRRSGIVQKFSILM